MFISKHRVYLMLAMAAVILVIAGTCELAKASTINIQRNYLFVVETKYSDGLWNVMIIFTRTVSPAVATEIASNNMKLLRKLVTGDIMGSAWLWPDGRQIDESPVYLSPNEQFLLMKKGSNIVEPF